MSATRYRLPDHLGGLDYPGFVCGCLTLDTAELQIDGKTVHMPLDILTEVKPSPLIAVKGLRGLVDSYYWYVKRYHVEHHDQSMPWDCCSGCSVQSDAISQYRALLARHAGAETSRG